MATPKTPQEMAAIAAKIAASVAARKASGGLTARQKRAAAKAAKAGQPYTAPAPKAPTSSYSRPSYGGRRRRRSAYTTTPTPTVAGPAFATPKPNYRALRLAALAAMEAAFVQKLTEQGITQDARDGYARYKSIKARALAASTTPELQNEADTALRVALITMVKLAC